MNIDIAALYEQTFHQTPATVTPLPGAGSNRRYYRLVAADGSTVIGVEGTSVPENQAFVTLAEHFGKQGLHVPQVLGCSADGLNYLQTDLGSVALYDRIAACQKAGAWDEATVAQLRRVMSDLVDLQHLGARGFDFSVCYPSPAFDRRSVMWDLNHFKYYFLKPSGVDFLESALEDDFETFASDLLTVECDAFLYRDFQSRNIMLCDEIPYYIDFQGGRKGPIYYDVASFLWQARAAYPDSLREELLQCYLERLRHYRTVDEAEFRRRLALFVLFRLMQVLGTYGLRGYVEHKALFVVSIPPALRLLRDLLDRHPAVAQRYPYLVDALRRMMALPRYQNDNTPTDGLTVRVLSFSYKKGIPEDVTGNGGGFVFDCRAIHNPGRYEPYKRLTGVDAPVIQFLEDDGEILSFMQHVYGLVDPAVDRYLRRGFSSLMVCFGCTGGQHRSVYAAQHTAEHIATRPGVRVLLEHREQGIKRLLTATSE